MLQLFRNKHGQSVDIESLSKEEAQEHLDLIEQNHPKVQASRSEVLRLRAVARGKRKQKLEDEYSFLDDEDFGKNPNYQEELEAWNTHNQKRRRQVKLPKGAKTLRYKPGSGPEQKLKIVSPLDVNKNFEHLKGNPLSEPLAIKTTLNTTDYYQRTSYGMDVGYSPLIPSGGKVFTGTKERTLKAMAGDLDLALAKAKIIKAQRNRSKKGRRRGRPKKKLVDKTVTAPITKPQDVLRLAVAKGLISVRDSPSSAIFNPEVDIDKTTRDTLEPTIAEFGNVLSLDLARAGELAPKAKEHQDKLLKSGHPFEGIFGERGNYLGIKAANLRKKDLYEN